jgi:hypothetical protein
MYGCITSAELADGRLSLRRAGHAGMDSPPEHRELPAMSGDAGLAHLRRARQGRQVSAEIVIRSCEPVKPVAPASALIGLARTVEADQDVDGHTVRVIMLVELIGDLLELVPDRGGASRR